VTDQRPPPLSGSCLRWPHQSRQLEGKARSMMALHQLPLSMQHMLQTDMKLDDGLQSEWGRIVEEDMRSKGC
jgi:hypothetical protein